MELSKILNGDASTAVSVTPIMVPPPTQLMRSSSMESDAEATPSQSTHSMRVGKWTEEEEQFALAMVKQFTAGMLTIATGTSLRSLLAKKLRCSPMRISTKLSMEFLGGERIPKKLGQKRFFPSSVSDEQRTHILQELDELERAFLAKEKLPMDHTTTFQVETPRTPASVCSQDDTESEADGSAPMRIGSWSDEEQYYASALIDGFLRGMLDIPQGTTLRAFLAEQLCCNPMRISKKLATGSIASRQIPKRLGWAAFQPARHIDPIESALLTQELDRLRATCFALSSAGTHATSIAPASPEGAFSPMKPSLKRHLNFPSLGHMGTSHISSSQPAPTHPMLPSLSYKKPRVSYMQAIPIA
ncbi:TPA: hypothetical protein N0F65_006252 [Lagenidium giganteum]|uniref:Uncharacterized protein n=1 Tax=Lagenidium giganteum TaxID=4803 RepID=A0AAV2Z3X8_9STRA|nr:TPA: hypothetical protein N0F65_006252 [Lagenidium giganteum]